MSADRPSPPWAEALPLAPVQPASAGLLEVVLPLWHRRWWLVAGTLLGAVLGFGLSLAQPVRFTGQASFVAQPVLRPSQSVVSSALPALAGLIGTGSSPADLHVAILSSQTIADHIVDRFDLQRTWGLATRTEARMKLARRVSFGIGRRDGVVQVSVDDDSPARAALMADEYIEELRAMLRGFALEEARQRRRFYEAQLQRARTALDEAQKQLQSSGFDRAALRAEPRAAAESYGRLQGEISAAEVRLAATRRARAEGSAEIQQQLSELAALRAQLSQIELPHDGGPGSFVARVREFKYAETLAESVARQAEAARVDEASDPVPLQVLDRAQTPEWPSSPVPMRWLALGAMLGLAVPAAWVLLRHRMALARLDAGYLQRVELIRSVLPRRHR